ncbi:hypothetical protein QQ045_009572 [Rhodiola kirilowii]
MAFLAKQAWMIYTQPELLVSKVYKAKYFHNIDMMQCSLGYRLSYCWRSILKGMELIRAGTERNQGGHLRWTENASGNFDISSAYKLSMRLNGMEDRDAVGCSDYTQSKKFWKDFWKMPVPRKIKVFGWRGFHEALPTGISLHKRGLDNNVGCVICGYSDFVADLAQQE